MRPVRSLGGWLLVVWAAGTTCAQAHAHLQASVPRDGSTLGTAPVALVLQFSEAARLTALWIEKSGAEKQKLTPLPPEPQSRCRCRNCLRGTMSSAGGFSGATVT